jgi:hypothetical protein
LILLLWLPALATLLPGEADARLPFCCRRQGAHHCAMETGGAGEGDSSGPVFAAPSHCPLFPGSEPATVGRVFVVAAGPAVWTAEFSRIDVRVGRREAARDGRLRTQLDRGPPSSAIA